MKFSKHTSDNFFKITVESEALSDDLEDNEAIPSESLQSLILELELLAAELRKLLDEDSLAKPN